MGFVTHSLSWPHWASFRGIGCSNKERIYGLMVCVCFLIFWTKLVPVLAVTQQRPWTEAVLGAHRVILGLHKEMRRGHRTAAKSLVYVLMLPLVVFSFMCFVTELVLVHCSSRVLGIPQERSGTNPALVRKWGAGWILAVSPCCSIYSNGSCVLPRNEFGDVLKSLSSCPTVRSEINRYCVERIATLSSMFCGQRIACAFV